MKNLFFIFFIFNVFQVHSKEVEIPNSPLGVNTITLPDKDVLYLSDFNGLPTFSMPIDELEKKIPELYLPPRGKVDLSGIYYCPPSFFLKTGGYFSIYHYQDRVLLINVSQDKLFLELLYHIHDEEKLSVLDFSFIHTDSIINKIKNIIGIPYEESIGFTYLAPTDNLKLSVQHPAKGSLYSIGLHLVHFPDIEAENLIDFIDVIATFMYFEGQPLKLTVTYSGAALFSTTPVNNCPRVF